MRSLSPSLSISFPTLSWILSFPLFLCLPSQLLSSQLLSSQLLFLLITQSKVSPPLFLSLSLCFCHSLFFSLSLSLSLAQLFLSPQCRATSHSVADVLLGPTVGERGGSVYLRGRGRPKPSSTANWRFRVPAGVLICSRLAGVCVCVCGRVIGCGNAGCWGLNWPISPVTNAIFYSSFWTYFYQCLWLLLALKCHNDNTNCIAPETFN